MTDNTYICNRCNLSFNNGRLLGGHVKWKCRYPATSTKRKFVEEEEEENILVIEENLYMEDEVKYECMQ